MAVNVAYLVDPKDGGAVHPSPRRAGAQWQRARVQHSIRSGRVSASWPQRAGGRLPAGRRRIDPAGGMPVYLHGLFEIAISDSWLDPATRPPFQLVLFDHRLDPSCGAPPLPFSSLFFSSVASFSVSVRDRCWSRALARPTRTAGTSPRF
jgi:hypothetical protein